MGIASLILGILSLIFAVCVPVYKWMSVIMAIIGIITGAVGKGEERYRGMATAGLALSIVALVLGSIFWIACTACYHAIGGDFWSILSEFM